MAQPRILAAGYVCLDILPSIPPGLSLSTMAVPGKLVEVGGARVAPGGAVSNTGIALHRLGEDVKLLGKVGDDGFGRMLLATFRASSPKLADDMVVDPEGATSYTLCIQPPGKDRMFLCCPGGNATFASLDVSDAALASADHLHFGYPPLMRRMFADGGAELVSLFRRAKAAGLSTSLDMTPPDPTTESGRVDWPAILARVLPFVDFYVPSLDETVFMLWRDRFAAVSDASVRGAPLGGLTPADVEALAADALALGPAAVLLKLGKEGAYVRASGDRSRFAAVGRGAPIDADAWLSRSAHARCFSVPVAGTTGSGDCTIAGFLAAAGRGAAPEAALRMAVSVGSEAVTNGQGANGLRDYDAIAARFAPSDFPRDPAPAFPVEV